ncbi:hypothetical protein ONV78_16940 [Hahella sp. CR1]|uniref:hypothetical protein n=1 Tax=Hahella sp. CR1 TaxID=2992807 RepID=UPI002441A03C|nr:hypothetical protein [Hahella sp. CR1]MDG9669428.1 hypothetical protein [Hahella sp. CR1]
MCIGIRSWINKKLALVMILFVAGCSNGNGSANNGADSQVCGGSSESLGDDKYSIDSYQALGCKNSADLNGVWVAVSKWDNEYSDGVSTVTYSKGMTRKIVFVRELPDGKISINSCGGSDSIYAIDNNERIYLREGNEWYQPPSYGASRYTVNRHSNDRLSLTHFEGFHPLFSGSRRAHNAEIEWIKIAGLDSGKGYGKYYIYNHSDEKGNVFDGEYNIACFKESDGEIKSVNRFVPEKSDADYIPFYELYVRETPNDDFERNVNIVSIQGKDATFYLNSGYFKTKGVFAYNSLIDTVVSDFVNLPSNPKVNSYVNLSFH